uniref:Secreted protein n=1 Tax=Steinernema glaseri TaxID=37863 RepID=A0A1I7YEM0_9BILA
MQLFDMVTRDLASRCATLSTLFVFSLLPKPTAPMYVTAANVGLVSSLSSPSLPRRDVTARLAREHILQYSRPDSEVRVDSICGRAPRGYVCMWSAAF